MLRVKQFLSAIRAKISPNDEIFAKRNLSPAEYCLFNQMSLPDKRHCLNVAYTALNLAKKQHVDIKLLIKACLLHDVGRQQGDVSTLDKVAAVLAKKVFGCGSVDAWGKPGKGRLISNLRHALYVSMRHPQIGADRLRLAGADEAVIRLVRDHHQACDNSQPPELKLLQQADDLN